MFMEKCAGLKVVEGKFFTDEFVQEAESKSFCAIFHFLPVITFHSTSEK